MAEQLWSREEYQEGKVALYIFYEDSTPEQLLTRIWYQNLGQDENGQYQRALLEVGTLDGKYLDFYLPANTTKEETFQSNRAPSLVGVNTAFTWPANMRIRGRDR